MVLTDADGVVAASSRRATGCVGVGALEGGAVEALLLFLLLSSTRLRFLFPAGFAVVFRTFGAYADQEEACRDGRLELWYPFVEDDDA